MKLSQAIELIKDPDIPTAGKTCWTDLGCGSGLFTNALSFLLEPESTIYAVDKNIHALSKLEPMNNIAIEKLQSDFINDELNFNDLDGILMANSLHFVRDKATVINKMIKLLKENGCFLIVEYDTDSPNPWVTYPVSYRSLTFLFEKHRYGFIKKINQMPSKYNRSAIYSALIRR